jgi:hypothetical protein
MSEDLGWASDDEALSQSDPNRELNRRMIAKLELELQIEPPGWNEAHDKKLLTVRQQNAMIQALRLFGLDALHTNSRQREVGLGDDRDDPDTDFDQLRSLMWARLRRLWQHAEKSAQPLRGRAHRMLGKILKGLVPNQRGRGTGMKTSPIELLLLYYEYLLRWSLLQPAHREQFENRLPTEKSANAVARKYHLPKDQVRRYFRIDTDGRFSPGRFETPHRFALSSVASALKIKESTLEKELSKLRRKPARSK